MKLKVLFFLALMVFAIPLKVLAMKHSHSDAPSIHGMVITGSQKIYLSHLPMFHSPHDYQVILEVTLDDAGTKAYQKSYTKQAGNLYTLAPEVFVLPDMVHEPRTFQAALFAGHFERGGQEIAANVTVKIEKVLYFKKFSATEAAPKFAEYLIFGNEVEQFMVHKITAAPDYDQILKVKLGPKEVEKLKQTAGVLEVTSNHAQNITIPGPLVPPASAVLFASAKDHSPLFIEIKKEIYLEFGDLAD